MPPSHSPTFRVTVRQMLTGGEVVWGDVRTWRRMEERTLYEGIHPRQAYRVATRETWKALLFGARAVVEVWMYPHQAGEVECEGCVLRRVAIGTKEGE